MKIIADENIPAVAQAFGTLGEVTLLPGRMLRSQDVRAADVLLVRSVTHVGRELLHGSRVRFVGSATIGFDHVDLDYLQSRSIGFATAPGSNATSAAEYVVSALLALGEREGFSLARRTIGIVGCGNVGSRVRDRLAALGCDCLINDPPLRERGGHDAFVGLDDILQADIISVHVPLERSGRHPTRHLFDESFLQRMKPNAVLINTSRGAVVDNAALDALLARRRDLCVALDVWEGEPAIDMRLLEKVTLGTAHIAGYSLDGKLRGTEMIYRAACDYLGCAPRWDAAAVLPAANTLDLRGLPGGDDLERLRAAVFNAYDIRADDERLRELLRLPPAERPAGFDRLRKEYPVRREFAATTVIVDADAGRLCGLLRGIGFNVVDGSAPDT
ncbi:MAG: 4-phosphoerythronate dehydrogenase PdxB [Gammaproteobacteria bacterium]